MIKDFLIKYGNARKVVAQIKRGEWIPEYNEYDDSHITAYCGEYELWIGSGGFFCEITEISGKRCRPAFGLFWRHYVWWAAARKLKAKADSATETTSRIN